VRTDTTDDVLRMRTADLSLATRSSNVSLGLKLGVLLKARTDNLRKGQ